MIAVLTVTVGASAVAASIAPATVGAHTDVEYTVPTADETVAGPVGFITVAFADAVTLVGDGFEVFTPDQQIVRPFVFTEDNVVFQLQVEPPLAGGDVGVRYEVTAADGHILEGSFAFTVLAAPATSGPATTAPATSAPVESVPEQVTADAGTTPALVVATGPADGDTGSGGGSTGLVLGVVVAAVAAVVAGGAVVLLRARRSGGGGA